MSEILSQDEGVCNKFLYYFFWTVFRFTNAYYLRVFFVNTITFFVPYVSETVIVNILYAADYEIAGQKNFWYK